MAKRTPEKPHLNQEAEPDVESLQRDYPEPDPKIIIKHSWGYYMADWQRRMALIYLEKDDHKTKTTR